MATKENKSKSRIKKLRISNMSARNLMRLLGFFVSVFALFAAISMLSYLFTWKADQSLLLDENLYNQDIAIENNGGKLGFKFSSFLIGKCFGLPALLLVVVLVAWGLKLFMPRKNIRTTPILVKTVTAVFIFSWLFALISPLVHAEKWLSGGLGGEAGNAMILWLKNLVGTAMSWIIVLVLLVVWLLFVSDRFSAWYEKAEQNNFAFRKKKTSDGAKLGDDNGIGTGEEDGTDDDDEVEVGGNGRGEDGRIGSDGGDVRGNGFGANDGSIGGNGAGIEEDSEVNDGVESVRDGNDVVEIDEQNPFNDVISKPVTDLEPIDVHAELSKYVYPSLDLLNDSDKSNIEVSRKELEQNSNTIINTLLEYKVRIDSIKTVVGPTVTLYKLTPAPGTKVASIKNLSNDIALSLKTRGVRVTQLSDSIGIEVANHVPVIVPLKKLLNDDSYRNSKAALPVAIGYTVTQNVKVFDLADAPHLLVAGATKQGKSVCLNVIIASLLYAKHPSELKFVFIDPKMVEFTMYKHLLKHFLAVLPTAKNEEDEKNDSIVTKPKSAEEILASLCVEMDSRFELMKAAEVNNVKLYNDKYKSRRLSPEHGHRFLPYIVTIIDEFADLTMSSGTGPEGKSIARNINTSITRLAQKGRAAGIHVIIATQRPTVNIITGEIKTNFPVRIAFRVVSKQDSQTILDSIGAENLIGKGDMLFYAGVEIERVQCAYIDLTEMERINKHISSQTGYKECYTTPYYLPEPPASDGDNGSGAAITDLSSLDSLFTEAAQLVVVNRNASASDLQRKMGIGFARAGRLIDQLESAGIIGPKDGSKPRQVLIDTLEDLRFILDANK